MRRTIRRLPRAPGGRARLGLSTLAILFSGLARAHAVDVGLPPPSGPISPRVQPVRGDDGLYHQSWFLLSFLDLRQDFRDAKKAGKRFAVLFEERRGCPYCADLHTKVLARKYINDYVRRNFAILQLDLWGAREVTDFDGARMTEKALAERWGISFTPTILFYKEEATGLDGKWGRELEAVDRLALSFGHDTFYDLFVWVRARIYERDRNFQRFHIARSAERAAMKADAATAGSN
jgi:Thioredoxin-like domain